MPDAVAQINAQFAPRQLVKADRHTEPLPLDKRQLSSYRTRLGTILEYALNRYIDETIETLFGLDLRVTFAVAHEYPDFYMRDARLTPRVRIEMKAVDADSDEQAARFEVLKSLIQQDTDVVILIGWEWHSATLDNATACEYPFIFSFVVVPAAELANERDQSVVLRGGRVDPDRILVPSKKQLGQLTPDQGNAGKILRLIHTTRQREPFALSQHILRYLQFTHEVGKRVSNATPLRRKTRQRKDIVDDPSTSA